MGKILLIILLLALCGCGTSVRIGTYANTGTYFEGSTDIAVFQVSTPLSKYTECSYIHVSHWSSGWPGNDDYEEWLDLFGCSFAVTFH